jgi:glycosyltransferase involved in cell wall biosynthesis
MKLLIVTQKIDKNDGVLGFFHAWVVEFAKHCEKITVICLQKGEYDFPKNVHVLSLGKEEGGSRLKYFFRFYRYIWRERKNYDSVFVHMNREYVLLGGVLWRAWGKKIMLWSNHKKGNIFTRIAVYLSDVVFCTSKFSYTAQFNKTKLMPVGVDTELFKRATSAERKKNSILCIGRIAPVKNIDVLIDALLLLDNEGRDFTATLVGDSLLKDAEYLTMIRTKAAPLLEKGKIQFLGSIPNDKTTEIYNRHEVYVNLTDSGSFDKTILEAMACECLIIASNVLLKDTLTKRFLFEEKNPGSLAEKLQAALSLPENEKEASGKTFRRYALSHDISRLAERLFDTKGK